MAETALGGNVCKNCLEILPRQQGKMEQARGICLSAPSEKRFSEKKAFFMPFGKFLEEGELPGLRWGSRMADLPSGNVTGES